MYDYRVLERGPDDSLVLEVFARKKLLAIR
jgi:hypothetical protein